MKFILFSLMITATLLASNITEEIAKETLKIQTCIPVSEIKSTVDGFRVSAKNETDRSKFEKRDIYYAVVRTKVAKKTFAYVEETFKENGRCDTSKLEDLTTEFLDGIFKEDENKLLARKNIISSQYHYFMKFF